MTWDASLCAPSPLDKTYHNGRQFPEWAELNHGASESHGRDSWLTTQWRTAVLNQIPIGVEEKVKKTDKDRQECCPVTENSLPRAFQMSVLKLSADAHAEKPQQIYPSELMDKLPIRAVSLGKASIILPLARSFTLPMAHAFNSLFISLQQWHMTVKTTGNSILRLVGIGIYVPDAHLTVNSYKIMSSTSENQSSAAAFYWKISFRIYTQSCVLNGKPKAIGNIQRQIAEPRYKDVGPKTHHGETCRQREWDVLVWINRDQECCYWFSVWLDLSQRARL